MIDIFPDWQELPEDTKDRLCKLGKEHKRLLFEEPTVDAVEVVRCKDCKHFINPTCSDGLCDLDGENRIIWLNDDFCSYGERKDNEN